MKKTINPIIILIILFIGCTKETSVLPTELDRPEKLYPYEVIYDSVTFKERRDNLINQIPDDAVVIITTNDIYMRNGDIDYEFRPASCFYYLTGFDEPNAVALIRKNVHDQTKSELIMFVETRDGTLTQWLGPVYGPDGAISYFGADTAFEIGDFGPKIESYLADGSYQYVYTNLDINQLIEDTFYAYVKISLGMMAIDDLLDPMRTIKSPIEKSSVQKAVDVSIQAFTEAIVQIEPGMYEYEVEAIYDYIIALNGCPRTAFPTIVASGPNINILHYQTNQRQMLDGDLVMIDFGAEYGYYAADITRTLPVNGTFSEKQAEVYNIVLEAHKAVIENAAPGVSYYSLYYLARDIIIDGLLDKGIVNGERSEIISLHQYRNFIPAGLGHCVGLDVHDPFPKEESGDKILKENMILAIEPHIYLFENDALVDPVYWNISARIEDDILITTNGAELLSKDLPIEIGEIEKFMK